MPSPLEAVREITVGQLAALVVKLGGEENFRRVLRGEMKFVLEVVNMMVTINRAEPFDSAFIGPGWTIWRGPASGNGLEGEEQQDARSLALTDVDFTKARFETCLTDGETAITGENRLCRLLETDLIRGDAKFGQVLYQEPGQKTLRWLFETYGVTWFELPGTILRNPYGHRYFLFLSRGDDGQWYWYYRWLDDDRNARRPGLVFAS